MEQCNEQLYLNKHLGKQNLSVEEKSKLKAMFIGSGAIAEGHKIIEDYYQKGEKMLIQSGLNAEQTKTLYHIIATLRNRIT